MKTNILNKYNLKFVVIEIYGERWKHCSIENDNKQTTLGCFLSCWQRTRKIDQLIADIDDLLQGNARDIATGCDAVLIDIYRENTEFFDISARADFKQPDLIIPTNDFKSVLKEWKRFLTTPAIFSTHSELIAVA